MSKKVVIASALLILSLLVMMTGCAKPLTLKIWAPLDGYTLTTSPIVVRGNVSDAKATAQVNDDTVPVDNQGNFTTTIEPQEGKNTIEIVATVEGKEPVAQTITVTCKPSQ